MHFLFSYFIKHRIALICRLFHIYFHLKCNLLYSRPFSTLHGLAAYYHFQASSMLLQLLHCMSKFCIECKRDSSPLK
jgi:hypothetical protein